MFNMRNDVKDITISAFELNGQSLYSVKVMGNGIGNYLFDKTLAFNKNQEKFLISKSKERKMRENGLHTYLIERRAYSYKGGFYFAKTQVQDNFNLYPEEVKKILVDFFED